MTNVQAGRLKRPRPGLGAGLLRIVRSAVRAGVGPAASRGGFRQVCLVEYPDADSRVLGLVADEAAAGRNGAPDLAVVFVPTAPDPATGFLIHARRSELTLLDMPVGEALARVRSSGRAGDRAGGGPQARG